MKGTLHKTERGWHVQYTVYKTIGVVKKVMGSGHKIKDIQSLPLFQEDAAGLFIQDTDSKHEGIEVEFEIFDNREICNCACHKNADITHFVACCNDGYKTDNLGHVNYYAKLVHNWLTIKEGDITVNFKTMPEFDEPAYPNRLVQLKEQAWDVIYQEFIKNTDGISSLALLEYLKDNYNPPIKKQNNSDKKYSEQDVQNILDGFTNKAPGEYIKTNFIGLLNKNK